MKSLTTKFLPAVRSRPSEIKGEAAELSVPFVQLVIDAIPMTVLVLNKNRQIVLSNRAVLNLTGLTDIDAILGLRPGELLHCIHATEKDNGCGTTEFCRVCGAASAIVSSQNDIPDVKECRISTSAGGAIDIRVWTTPFHIKKDSFTLFSVSDTTDEKRRRALERIFFHDIMNSLSAIRAMSETLKDSPLKKSMKSVT